MGKGVRITRMGTGKNYISYAIIQYYWHTYDLKIVLIALALPIFLLYEVEPADVRFVKLSYRMH